MIEQPIPSQTARSPGPLVEGHRLRRHVRPFIAGLLAANSLPHLATAAAGRTHLTPLAGHKSSRWVNLAWGAANLVAALVLIGASSDRAGRWDSRIVAFDAGAATFALWMATTESGWAINWDRDAD